MYKRTRLIPKRRRLLKAIAATTLTGGIAPIVMTGKARANQETLRILRWKNFIPEFETWFNDKFVKEWERKNNIRVVVDNVGMGEVDSIANAEAQEKKGHDLVLFLAPRPLLEDDVIDHREIYEECKNRYGEIHEFVRRSCYNPVTQRYHGFCESYIPVLLTYRKDLWDAVGLQPSTWDKVREGGRAIKLLHESPVGISLTPEHNSQQTLRAIMSCFGASVQDENGNPSLLSKETTESLKYVKALYKETMTPDVLNWTPPSNNQFMLAGNGCLTVDSISIIRAAQTQNFPVNKHLALATLPEGPAGAAGPLFGANVYVIWKFANNPDAAKKFLIDYMANLADGIRAAGFQNLPSYPNSVPGFRNLLNSDDGPSGRYDVLNDVPASLRNLGYPGYTNAAIDEVRNTQILPLMFSKVATGRISPDEAASDAHAAIKPIFEKWRNAGKI